MQQSQEGNGILGGEGLWSENWAGHPFEIFQNIGTSTQFSRGTVIFQEGAYSGSVHLICAGRVKLSAASREGRTLILRIAQAGEVPGLAAVLAGYRYQLTAEAMEDCLVKSIRRQALLEFLDRNPKASIHIARALAYDYKAAFSEVRRLALPSTASGRVAGLLLDWIRGQSPADGPLSHCTIPLTHEEIASMTATTRETVTRVLGQLKRDRLISIRGDSLTVLQPEELEKLAH